MFSRALHRIIIIALVDPPFFEGVAKATAPRLLQRRQALFNDDSWMMDGVVFVLVSAVCVRVCAYV